MKFENTIVINKPSPEVFAYLAHLENLSQWNYAIRRTIKVTPGPIAIGTVYRQDRTLPRPMSEELRVAAYEPSSLLTVEGGFGPFEGGVAYYLEPVTGNSMRLTNVIELQAAGVLSILSPLASHSIKGAVSQNLKVLKTLLER